MFLQQQDGSATTELLNDFYLRHPAKMDSRFHLAHFTFVEKGRRHFFHEAHLLVRAARFDDEPRAEELK